MVDIKKFLLETARQKKARVIIPEADDERVVKAADIILKEKILRK